MVKKQRSHPDINATLLYPPYFSNFQLIRTLHQTPKAMK